MEWMATITGDHVGYPGGFGEFFSKKGEKSWGVESCFLCLIFSVERDWRIEISQNVSTSGWVFSGNTNSWEKLCTV